MWLLALAALHTALTALSRVEGLSLDMGSCESLGVDDLGRVYDVSMWVSWGIHQLRMIESP